MPLPGMTSYPEPHWWHDDALEGITNLLPSSTEVEPRSKALERGWKLDLYQNAIYPTPSGAPPLPMSLQAQAKAPPLHTDGPGPGPGPEQLADGSKTARTPRLPPLPASTTRGGSGAQSARTAPRRTRAADGDTTLPHLMPRSMARAVEAYQHAPGPSGLYTPRAMFKSPRAAMEAHRQAMHREPRSTPRATAQPPAADS